MLLRLDPATGRVLALLPIADVAQAGLVAVTGGHLYYAVPTAAGSRILTVPVPATCR